MTVTIALAGKGGTGKTTVSAMVVRYLLEEKRGAVLAIDADPSSNLNMVLGLDLDELQIQKIGLCHCTGPRAVARMIAAFGDRYIFCNAGTRHQLP